MTENSGNENVKNETAGLINAAKWGIWVWIGLAVIPLIVVVLCCFGCFSAGIIGSVTDLPSSSPTSVKAS